MMVVASITWLAGLNVLYVMQDWAQDNDVTMLFGCWLCLLCLLACRKSTLLNTLTAAGVLAEDKLFATLDPTTRKVRPSLTEWLSPE